MQTNLYNDVLKDLQDYMLTENNIDKSLEMKIRNIIRDKSQTNFIKQQKSLFIPKEKDSLFWCFYIIKNGEIKYDTMTNRNEIIAKQIKISYIEKIRKEKQTIKIYKFDSISNIESNLVNDNVINSKTFLTLCALENLNIIFISNKTYFQLSMNDSKEIFIINEINNSSNGRYNIKYGFELGTDEAINNIKDSFYYIDKIDKPIKSLSCYKTKDLLEICIKLAIETTNKDTNKTKSKKELYEGIIKYF
jgi:hypothetical protein